MMKRRRRRKRGRFLIRTGILLIAAAAALAGWNVYDSFAAGQAARESASYLETILMPQAGSAVNAVRSPAEMVDEEVSIFFETTSEEKENFIPAPAQSAVAPDLRTEIVIPDYKLNPNMEMPVIRHEGQDYIGLLEIPALDLKLPIISEWNYSRLKKAPCRYTGSAYTNNLVIAAHNYETHFGNLNKLYEGAAVRFTDADGNVFNYRVELKETLNPRDVEYMKDSGWDLSLFTCTPGGSYRVTIRCARKV